MNEITLKQFFELAEKVQLWSHDYGDIYFTYVKNIAGVKNPALEYFDTYREEMRMLTCEDWLNEGNATCELVDNPVTNSVNVILKWKVCRGHKEMLTLECWRRLNRNEIESLI